MKRIISLMLTLAVALSLLVLPAGAASTPEEAAESRAVLSAFRSGHMDAVPMPREGFSQEMG